MKLGLEAHVHDEARFAGGWAFFDLSAGSAGKLVPAGAACYSCHRAHGAVDTTFTQFYPSAKQIAQRKGTYEGR